MVVKEQWRMDGFIRSCKALGPPRFICRISRYSLAEVYCMDGKAVVVPGMHRAGILVVEWNQFMRYVRRHELV